MVSGISSATYRLDTAPIGSGGEGDIFPVQGDASRVAKIYKSGAVSSELEEKLKIMTMNPPSRNMGIKRYSVLAERGVFCKF